jgi:thioredoxin 1
MIINRTVNITTENFDDKIKNSKIALLDIWAEWCGPCKTLSPIIEQVSSELPEEIVVGKMDAEQNMEFLKSMNVRNIPTIIFYKEGVESTRTVGVKTKREILDIIESLSKN